MRKISPTFDFEFFLDRSIQQVAREALFSKMISNLVFALVLIFPICVAENNVHYNGDNDLQGNFGNVVYAIIVSFLFAL